MRTYRSYLNAVGRKPLPNNLRTTRREGDREIVRDRRAPSGWREHIHTLEASNG